MNKRQLGAAITLAVAFSGTSVLPAMAAGDGSSPPATTADQNGRSATDTEGAEAPAPDDQPEPSTASGTDGAPDAASSASPAENSGVSTNSPAASADQPAPSVESSTAAAKNGPPVDDPIPATSDEASAPSTTSDAGQPPASPDAVPLASDGSDDDSGSDVGAADATTGDDGGTDATAGTDDGGTSTSTGDDGGTDTTAGTDDGGTSTSSGDDDDTKTPPADDGDTKTPPADDGDTKTPPSKDNGSDKDDPKSPPTDDPTDQPTKPAKPTPKPARLSISGTAFASDANHNGRRDAGDTVTFSYTVTNTGMGKATGLRVTSALGATTCGRAILPAGGTAHCTITSSISQSDVDRGSVTNRATARAVGGNKAAVSASSGVVSVALKGTGKLAATQGVTQVTDLNRDGHAGLGDKLRYTLQVTNTGSLTVTGLSITDSKLSRHGVSFSCPTSTLAPGTTVTCTSARYAVNRWEAKNSPLTNHALARGTTSRGVTVASNGTVTYRLTVAPPARVHQVRHSQTVKPKQHTWVKKTPSNHATWVKPHKVRLVAKIRAAQWVSKVNDKNKNGRYDAGDSAVYSFKVVNVGNLTVTDVTIVDRKLARKNLKITCDRTTLLPGATAICHAEPLVFTKWQAKNNKPLGKNWAYATAVASTGKQIRSNGTKTDHGIKAKQDPEPNMLAYTGIDPGGLLLSGVFLVGAGTLLRVGSRRRARRN